MTIPPDTKKRPTEKKSSQNKRRKLKDAKYDEEQQSIIESKQSGVHNDLLQKEILDMRSRVELQLKSLLRGAEANQVRQQVADLKGYTSLAKTGEEENDAEVLENTLLSLPGDVIENNSIPGIIDLTEPILKDDNTEAPQNMQQEVSIIDEETSHVEKETVMDAYGDKGSYSGEILVNLKKPQGFGTMIYEDGRTFSGSWKCGKWHGNGVASFANGDKYDGSYDLDRRHGFGVYSWKDGRVYEGEFYHDQRQGSGEYHWPDGALYRGEFMAGRRHGEGAYTYADGSVYTGEWAVGSYHGVGHCVWGDGRTYQGDWKQGKADGYGIEKRNDGSIRHEGMWKQDVPLREQKQKETPQQKEPQQLAEELSLQQEQ